MQDIVAKSRDSVERSLRGMDRCTVYQGTAHFVSATELQVGPDILKAPHIFLNVGARPTIPKLPGVDTVPYLTSSTILALGTLPPSLVVVGVSYVGLEFAQMYRRFGSDVTVVERGTRLVAHEDEDVSRAVREILEAEGIRVRLNAECISLIHGGDGLVVGVSCIDDEQEVEASHVLLAMGHTPNTDDLRLEAAGISVDEDGYIPVYDRLCTAVPGIWALGDCNGRGGFTHLPTTTSKSSRPTCSITIRVK